MVPVILSGGWAALVLALLGPWRPPPRRLAPGRGGPGGAGRHHRRGSGPWPSLAAAPAAPAGRLVVALAASCGRRLRAVSGRPPAPEHDAGLGALALGLALLAALAGVRLAAAVAGVVVLHRTARARRARRRAAAQVVGVLPEVVDLLRLAVDAGCTVPLALRAVVPLAPAPFAAALAEVVTRAERGVRLADALDRLPADLGEPVRPLAAALAGSERYGTPLGPTLDRLADEVRRDRRRRAEETARTLPVRLLFPLVLGTLPALVLLTIAPVVAGALRSLHL